MNRAFLRIQLPVSILLAVLSAETLYAQQRGAPAFASPCYDQITTNDQKVYRGFLLGRDENNDVNFVVRRKWLADNDRGYNKLRDQLEANEKIAYEELLERTESWLDRNPNAKHRFILQREKERAARWLGSEKHEESAFVVLTLPQKSVQRFSNAQPQFVKLGQWAWVKEVANCESSSPKELQSELEKLKVDPTEDVPDLGRRLQAIPQSSDEWRARLAIVEYGNSEIVAFQGSGDTMIRVPEEGKAIDVGPLFGKLMQDQTQSLLEELLGNNPKRGAKASSTPSWYLTVQRKADELSKHYVRGTSVDNGLGQVEATVESMFAVKFSDNTWQTVWRSQRSQSTRDLPADTLRTLYDDPQIKKIKETAENLGVSLNDQFDQAIRFGAATMSAQKAIDYEFELFRQRYSERLDIPVLRWKSN